MFFDGFDLDHVELPEGRIRLRRGGSGPALLLLHGNPQTHAMWHKVAPDLARDHTVICPDLRGYGGSFRPNRAADPRSCSKQALAGDMTRVMSALGHDRFAVVGHDRGGSVAHRIALDAPERVSHVGLLDIVPTLEHFERADMSFALAFHYFVWFAQPHPKPEALISKAPSEWFGGQDFQPEVFSEEAVADYRAALSNRDDAGRLYEDYQAGAAIDLIQDRLDKAGGRRIAAPTQVLWGTRGQIGGWYDPRRLWQDHVVGPVQGAGIGAGHYFAEEAPAETLAHLQSFLAS